MTPEKMVSYILVTMHAATCGETPFTEDERVARLRRCERLLHHPQVKEWARKYVLNLPELEEIRVLLVGADDIDLGIRRN